LTDIVIQHLSNYLLFMHNAFIPLFKKLSSIESRPHQKYSPLTTMWLNLCLLPWINSLNWKIWLILWKIFH